jgi:hypothetical protein
MGRLIKMALHNREVRLSGDGTGTVMSDLFRDPRYMSNPKWQAAVDAIENTVLAHALSGINVSSPFYVKGLDLAFRAVDELNG